MNQTCIHRCCHAYDKCDAAHKPLLLVDDRAIHEQIAQPNQQNYGETKAHPKGAKLTLTAKTLIDPMGQITSWHLRCEQCRCVHTRGAQPRCRLRRCGERLIDSAASRTSLRLVSSVRDQGPRPSKHRGPTRLQVEHFTVLFSCSRRPLCLMAYCPLHLNPTTGRPMRRTGLRRGRTRTADEAGTQSPRAREAHARTRQQDQAR
jgi:hypothetical protein